METILPQQQADILVRYQRWRAIGRRLNSRLVESLDKNAIDEAGQRLGILRKGVFCFDTEDTASVLMDYAIRHIRSDGQNAVEHYLAHTPPSDCDEMAWVKAVCQTRYRILQVEKVHPGLGLQVCDIFRDESALLIDVSFSRTASRHFVLASHVYRMGDYWATTGAALPVAADTLKRLIAQMERQFGRRPEDYRAFSPEHETRLATLVIRTCLADGMSQQVSYGETLRPHFTRSQAALPAKTHAGRNDPCPCRSGRKFKNCCLRRM